MDLPGKSFSTKVATKFATKVHHAHLQKLTHCSAFVRIGVIRGQCPPRPSSSYSFIADPRGKRCDHARSTAKPEHDRDRARKGQDDEIGRLPVGGQTVLYLLLRVVPRQRGQWNRCRICGDVKAGDRRLDSCPPTVAQRRQRRESGCGETARSGKPSSIQPPNPAPRRGWRLRVRG